MSKKETKVEEVKELTNEQKLEAYTEDLSRQMVELMRNYAARVSVEMGSDFTAGLLPFVQDVGQGMFKPAVKVAILPLQTQENDTGETKGKTKKGTRSTPAKKPRKS